MAKRTVLCRICRKNVAKHAWLPFGRDGNYQAFSRPGHLVLRWTHIEICTTCRDALSRRPLFFTLSGRVYHTDPTTQRAVEVFDQLTFDALLKETNRES